jgi:hypothetical protein
MQTVAEGFTAEERDSYRSIAKSLLVSWKKDTNLALTTFTIGVSAINGGDLIGINQGAIGSPSNYLYFDESDYVMSMAWERGLNMPTGGMTKALGEALLDNTSGRFLPNYMGGNSELFTAILPRRPFIMGAGFHYDGVDQTIQQFTGITTKQVDVNTRNRQVKIQGADYLDFFQNRYIDQTAMWTNTTADVIMESMMSQLGMSTAQYDLDTGINVIPFSIFNKGDKYGDIIAKLAEAENGHFYQDESGKLKFENRTHWDNAPYNAVQKIVLTGQVINAEVPTTDHIINVVEVKGKVRAKQPVGIIMNFTTATVIPANSFIELFFDYENPVLEVVPPTISGTQSYYVANTKADGTGTNKSSVVSVKSQSDFAQTSKIVFQNNSSANVFLTKVVLSGRAAKEVAELYVREQDSSSITAYEERKLIVENDFIQDAVWAESYAQMILNDYSEPENIQKITVRAMPSLQLGDLISWQGRHWRVYNIRTSLSASSGFMQELTLLQRNIVAYFRIGLSSIGGTDQVSP